MKKIECVWFHISRLCLRGADTQNGQGSTYDGGVPTYPESLLLCPVCRDPLTVNSAGQHGKKMDDGAARFLRCPRGHRFDAARQGYFNLLTGRGTEFESDTAAMVQARVDFLGGGHFQPLANAVTSAAESFAGNLPLVLDVGAGTGYYLKALQEKVSVSASVALDISKYALRRSAKELPDALCLVCDVWRPLPVADQFVDLLLNIFAPRNVPEFARVCSDGAVALVVTPLPHHLREIAELAGLLGIRPGKATEVAASMAEFFDESEARRVEFGMRLSPIDVRNVAAMGPAGHHTLSIDVDSLPPTSDVTAAFTVQVFQKRAHTG